MPHTVFLVTRSDLINMSAKAHASFYCTMLTGVQSKTFRLHLRDQASRDLRRFFATTQAKACTLYACLQC
jgi:hypothetical protein